LWRKKRLETDLIKKLLFILTSALVVTGMFSFVGCSSKAGAKDGDTVKVDYTLTLEDGTVYDTSSGKEPIEFIIGENKVIPGFEDAVRGMEVGETKTVTIPPEEGYGMPSANLVQVVEKSQLPADYTPVVGQYISGQSSDGTVRSFLITAVNVTTITVDGNSPLAGKTLKFELTLVEIVAK
jgi:FKBP-type peptidyl-prolyl cis-trans isomerase 2